MPRQGGVCVGEGRCGAAPFRAVQGCRYWCPLAAWNGILARWYGRLRIKSNDKCITCTECSRYCQVGVDVMAFAKNQVSFDNRNSNCIQCGTCIDVCPMDVLSFELEPRMDRPRTGSSEG